MSLGAKQEVLKWWRRGAICTHPYVCFCSFIGTRRFTYQLRQNRSGSEHDRSANDSRRGRSLQRRNIVCLQHPEADLHVQQRFGDLQRTKGGGGTAVAVVADVEGRAGAQKTTHNHLQVFRPVLVSSLSPASICSRREAHRQQCSLEYCPGSLALTLFRSACRAPACTVRGSDTTMDTCLIYTCSSACPLSLSKTDMYTDAACHNFRWWNATPWCDFLKHHVPK